MLAAWLAPVGPWQTPGWALSLSERFEGIAVHFVRLAGPLRVKKIVPVHDYTAVLPFQGSIELSDRELLSVTVGDPFIEGPIVLRGAVYDDYASGGWKAGPREEVDLAEGLSLTSVDALGRLGPRGRLVPLTVTVEAKSVVGTVLFTPGEPVSASVPARAKLVDGAVWELKTRREDAFPRWTVGARVPLPDDGGASLDDEEVLKRTPPGWTGLYVSRDETGRVQAVGAVPTDELDVLVLSPREKLQRGDSYSVLGLSREVDPDELRAASSYYPHWVRERYLDLPRLPSRIAELAWAVAGGEPTGYDRAKAIETYLRAFPVDYAVGDTPPGRDTVDYFLFQAKRGYFDYHASAMVVMLRSLGIPSRLAVGFVVDEDDLDPEEGAYVVQDKDVYAWAEVYFPGQGWLEFNPSPDRPAELRPSERADDILVPPLSLDDLKDLPVSTGGFFPDSLPEAGETSTPSATGGSGPGYALLIPLGVFAFLAAVAGSAALGWRQSVAGLPYPQQVWEKTVRLASWAGHPPRPGETPARLARRLRRELPDLADHVASIEAAYSLSRFGGRDPDEPERQRLRRVWPRLRNALLGRMYTRLWGRWW
jgi:transglutaminase-like putative cysteine protease